MKAVVPTAGAGTRLRPLTESRPKGLIEVAGTPILSRCFERLLDAGVDELIVVVGYRAADVVEYYGDSFQGIPVTYVHQGERRGLGDAVLRAEPFVDEAFVVLNGDNVVGTDLGDLLERQRADGVDATMLVEEASESEARTTGVAELTDGRVTGLVEKPDEPPSTVVSAGCYVLPPAVFHALQLARPGDRGELELTAAVDLLAAAGMTVEPVRYDGWRVNVNTPADVELAERKLRE